MTRREGSIARGPESYIGIDVGGSGLRVQLDGPDGRQRWRDSKALARLDGVITRSALIARIRALIDDALLESAGVARAVIGMTGMPVLVDSPELLGVELAHALDAEAVVVCNDVLTAHIGALAGQAGVVIAAGTGAIAVESAERTAPGLFSNS